MHRAVLWDPWLAEYEHVEAWIWRSQGSGGREEGRERERERENSSWVVKSRFEMIFFSILRALLHNCSVLLDVICDSCS